MIKEIPTFPMCTLSSAQGRVGTRKFVVTAEEDLIDFLRKVCASHWPGDPNTVPIMVQVGPHSDKPRMKGGIGTATNAALGDLLQFGETLVVVQYQFLHLHDCWSDAFPKPQHPAGTTLTLRVRGSGQFLLVTPEAVVAFDSPTGDATKQRRTDPTDNACRIIVPITEYHLTCDRLTEAQLSSIFATNSWKDLEGTVNKDSFLGEPAECMMFDTWEMDDAFAPDFDDPRRWKLTCCIRCRAIPNPADDSTSGAVPSYLGWNWDFRPEGWKYIKVRTHPGGSEEPRYKPVSFDNLFCSGDGCESESCGS